MKTRGLIAYVLMAMFSLAVSTFAIGLGICSKIFVEDGNLETFRKSLTDVERTRILNDVWHLSWGFVTLIVATNLLWIIGVGIALTRCKPKNA